MNNTKSAAATATDKELTQLIMDAVRRMESMRRSEIQRRAIAEKRKRLGSAPSLSTKPC